MTATPSTYSVGRGRPPLHTRFQKGQSGNPSGKPGPAKLAKQRFERALYAALEGSEAELEQSKPDNVIAGIARRMALDASAGRISAVKLILSLLDAESKKSAGRGADAAEQLFTGAEVLSLLQGKNQGNEERWLEDILRPDAHEEPEQPDSSVRKEQVGEAARAATTRGRNEAAPSSLVQGKTQGTDKKLTEQICPALVAEQTPALKRAQLMTGAAPVTSIGNIREVYNRQRAASFPMMLKGAAVDRKAAVRARAPAHGT
ncbi:MAG TPA: DUF5681 domain-containing protein [Rhizomicrobium sp.]|jgi:hypothetical protein